MIFAPALGFVILLILALRLLAVLSLIYIVQFIFRCFRSEEYLALIKSKSITQIIKLSLMAVLIVFTLFEYINSSKLIKRIQEETAIQQKELHPLLEKDTQIGEYLLPKGAQLESYNPKYDDFLSATFPSLFKFKGLNISYLENPDEISASVKLAEPSTIGGFTCEKDKIIFLNFENTDLWVQDCILANDQDYLDIKWAKGTHVDTSKEKIHLKGDAQFELNQTPYSQFLNYTYNPIKKHSIYKDKTGTVLFRNDPGYKTVKDKSGEYSIQFKGLIKGVNYKITNRSTGETHHGEPNENRISKKFITKEETVFDFEYIFINAK